MRLKILELLSMMTGLASLTRTNNLLAVGGGKLWDCLVCFHNAVTSSKWSASSLAKSTQAVSR